MIESFSLFCANNRGCCCKGLNRGFGQWQKSSESHETTNVTKSLFMSTSYNIPSHMQWKVHQCSSMILPLVFCLIINRKWLWETVTQTWSFCLHSNQRPSSVQPSRCFYCPMRGERYGLMRENCQSSSTACVSFKCMSVQRKDLCEFAKPLFEKWKLYTGSSPLPIFQQLSCIKT